MSFCDPVLAQGNGFACVMTQPIYTYQRIPSTPVFVVFYNFSIPL